MGRSFIEKVKNFTLVNYRKVPYEKFKNPEHSMHNGACHFNAVTAYYAGRADAVWLVIAISKNPVVHFINSKNGFYFDETWFHQNRNTSYHVIRRVNDKEFDDIYSLLVNTKQMLYDILGNWFDQRRAKNNIHCDI
jgi:hypothetical protein